MKKIISWVFGIIFILFGLGVMSSGSLLGGGIVLISGLAIIPPVKKKLKLSIFASILFLFVGLWVSFNKIQESITNEYNKNKNDIILSIENKIEKKEYDSAIFESEKYLITKDKDVENLNLKANNLKKEREKIQEEKIAREELIKKKNEKEKRLLSLLKRTDDDDFISISDYYNQLTFLVPENEEYKEKKEEFDKKLDALKKKKLEEKEATLLVSLEKDTIKEEKIKNINNDHWYLSGKSVAKIDAKNFIPKNSYHGLSIDCWETSGKMRVWVKDFVVANKENIYYETDNNKGIFRANKRYIAAPHPTRDKEITKKLIKALLSGSYINFRSKGVYNGEDIDAIESKDIKITYSLKGSNSIIRSLKCTERYLR
jgi:hypothetical protein